MAPNSKYNMQQRAQNQYPDNQQTQRQNRLVTNPKQQKVKKKTNEEENATEQESTEEFFDQEATCYINEIMEDWQIVSFINSLNLKQRKSEGH